ncbi:MAG TPA: hypothetical protein DCY82_18305 [Acidimicrobiaceae bacterium]|nr:hypothetical protein [Acidimicrobiaceae bacterium]
MVQTALAEHRLSMRGEPFSECWVGRSQETGRIADLVCKQLPSVIQGDGTLSRVNVGGMTGSE